MLKRCISVAFALVFTFVLSAQWASSQEEQSPVPAYHPAPPPPGETLPPLLKKEQLWGTNAQYPYQTHAYELAEKIPNVIYQQPCFCYCDRSGHKSLHSCYEGTHGAECSTCLRELYYSYLETKKGKTPTQIRAGIIKGEWKQIDLNKAAAIE